MAQVEAFLFEPLTPIVMMVNGYSTAVELTLTEAKQVRSALTGAIDKVEEK